jgi:hypothetical protein
MPLSSTDINISEVLDSQSLDKKPVTAIPKRRHLKSRGSQDLQTEKTISSNQESEHVVPQCCVPQNYSISDVVSVVDGYWKNKVAPKLSDLTKFY